MDIQKWFAIESPKEMSEKFAEISAIYYMALAGGANAPGYRAIERRLGCIEDQSEWFAACLCLESVAAQVSFEVRRVSGAGR